MSIPTPEPCSHRDADIVVRPDGSTYCVECSLAAQHAAHPVARARRMLVDGLQRWLEQAITHEQEAQTRMLVHQYNLHCWAEPPQPGYTPFPRMDELIAWTQAEVDEDVDAVVYLQAASRLTAQLLAHIQTLEEVPLTEVQMLRKRMSELEAERMAMLAVVGAARALDARQMDVSGEQVYILRKALQAFDVHMRQEA